MALERWLKGVNDALDKRIAERKEFEIWLEQNPEIKAEVDRLDNEATNHLARAGIAATASFASALFNLGGFVILLEYGRQMKMAGDKLNKKNQFIREHSPYKEQNS